MTVPERAKKERVLKVMILARRNPSLTEEEFHDHWTNVHAPLCAPWFQRHGIIRYIQYHTPEETRNMSKDIAAGLGWTVSPYDGHVEFLVRKLENVTNAMSDPDFPKMKGPAEKMLDLRNSMVTVGYEEVYVLDEKVVNVGDDGLTSAYKGKRGEPLDLVV